MNLFKTALLMTLLTALFIAVGSFWGQAGMTTAFVLACLLNFGSYWFSDKIVLMMYRAREVSPAEAPELVGMVRELTEQAGLPMPRVCVIPTDSPNAFATGRNPRHAAVAVTEGARRLLDRRELRAVIAHELAHVRHYDILTGAMVAAIASAIMLLATMMRWAALFGGFGRRDNEGANPIALLALAILAPIAATLIQLAISRSREYAADRAGARMSGDPLALASALRRLEAASRMRPLPAEPATAHMFIVNPLRARSLAALFNTHPPVAERIARLEAMARE